MLRRVRIAIDATPPRAAVPRHFRRVDPDQTHPLAVTAESVAIADIRLIAGDIGRVDVCFAKHNAGSPEKGDNDHRRFVGGAASFTISAPHYPLKFNDITMYILNNSELPMYI